MTKHRLKKRASIGFVVIICGLSVVCPLKAQTKDSVVLASQGFATGSQASFAGYSVFNYTGNITSVTFTVGSKAGSFVRPLSATFLAPWFTNHNAINGTSILVPVFGLFPGVTSNGVFTFNFSDGGSISLAESSANPTPAYEDPCSSLNSVKVTQQNRTTAVGLGFNYYLLKDGCSPNYPVILDTDGNIRWVAQTTLNPILNGNLPKMTGVEPAILYTPPALQNMPDTGNPGIYTSDGLTAIYRQELYGEVPPRKIGDYASVGNFEITSTAVHNFDPGRNGIIADVSKSTPNQLGPVPSNTGTQSVAIEVDGNTGKVLQLWDLASIISYAMQAGGASETEISNFVQPNTDWFHMNSTVYNPADNTLIVSSRENFVIAVDYDVPAGNQVRKIHWILGDPTKAWYQNHPSLRKFALALLPDEQFPPIGQHALSIDSKSNLLMFNDGQQSQHQSPPGMQATFSVGESFAINTSNMTATREFLYNRNPTIFNPYCGSIYEDALTGNYLVNYPDPTSPNGIIGDGVIQGIDSLNSVIFEVQFSQPNPNPQMVGCAGGGWNAFPLNLLNLTFVQ